ncbi:hypothetical protein MN116_006589 [Schistosoma mekongi]|uniref:RRM domain-containing protein n=1 Tax=Schistosoma mekongi TaxID=38744 RepID=A0AAE2D304_SCHME|nr:hypothetical protein MN116_006589 [Schistosoma mekongi]
MLMDDVKFQQSLSFHGSLPSSITSSDLNMSINNNNINNNDNIITTITTSSINNNVDPIYLNVNDTVKEKNVSTNSTRIQSPCYGNFTSSTISPITSPMALDQWSATLLAAQALVRTKKVFIGGVSTGTTTDELKTFFSEFGKVETCELMMDKATSRHRGFGFVTFESEQAAEKVCSIHYHELNGKMVEAKRALPKEVLSSSNALVKQRSLLPNAFALPNEVDSAATAAATIAAAALASRQQQQQQQQQHYHNLNRNLQNSGSAFVSLAYASLMPFNQLQPFPLTTNNYVGQPLTTSNIPMESSGIPHQNLHHSNPIDFPSTAVLQNGHSTNVARFPQFGLQNDIHLQPSCPINFTYNSPTAYINSTGGLTSSGNFLTTTIPNVLNITPSGTIQALLPNLTYNILTTLHDQRNQQSQLHQSQQTTLGQQSLQQQGQSIPPVSIDVETLKQQIQMQNWSNNSPYSLIALNQKTLEQIHSSTNLLNFNTNQKLSTIQSNESTTPTINLSDTSPTMWLLPAKIPRVH